MNIRKGITVMLFAVVIASILTLTVSPAAAFNLLTNPGAETGDLSGWTIIADGGDGWNVEEQGYAHEGDYVFVTSYGWCKRSQEIDLLAEGYTGAQLDASPTVNAEEWFKERDDVGDEPGDSYRLIVELQDENHTTIVSWDTGVQTVNGTSWKQESHTFSGYPSGLRYIYFEDWGTDSEGWLGWYGVRLDNASVRIESVRIDTEQKKIIDKVNSIMDNLKHTGYTNHNYIREDEIGAMFTDCSGFVGHVLKQVSEKHYDELPRMECKGCQERLRCPCNYPLAADYYDHFVKMSTEPDEKWCWQRVEHIKDAQPGDVIAYKYDPEEGKSTTGHVMIIYSTPKRSNCSDTNQYYVQVVDSADSGHYNDTRNGEGPYSGKYKYKAWEIEKPSGLGIGTMWFNTGSKPYYRWSSCSGTKHYANIAIGRPVECYQSGEMAPEKMVVNKLDYVVSNLNDTEYDHGPIDSEYINESIGKYHTDCSGLADFVLNDVLPDHYERINESATHKKWGRPRALDYYEFFRNRTNHTGGDNGWQRIYWMKNARPGDVIAYTYEPGGNKTDTGHVMFVYSTLEKMEGRKEYTFLIADSTSKEHGTRIGPGDGVGYGRIWMGVDDEKGRYIRWYDKDGYKNDYLIKIARPVELMPLPTFEMPYVFTTTDAVIALQIAVGSREYNSRWDVSGDGSVTSLDALMILQAVAGSIEIG
ncbi:MAG: hypothetical protein GWP10_07005 [Nitrospiraceae bacterium]|nr:hypothetical protein [Nitrospiraceae bacterium]